MKMGLIDQKHKIQDVTIKHLGCFLPLAMKNKLILYQIILKITFFYGDFLTAIDKKSAEGEYIEYWPYINAWIIRVAQKLNRTDITDAAYTYLDAYSVDNGGYLTNKVGTDNDGTTDLLTTAHLGFLQLERGNIDRAIKAGNYILKVLEKQLAYIYV